MEDKKDDELDRMAEELADKETDDIIPLLHHAHKVGWKRGYKEGVRTTPAYSLNRSSAKPIKDNDISRKEGGR